MSLLEKASDTYRYPLDPEAVARFVMRGSQVALGGFTVNRNPMLLAREIIRYRNAPVTSNAWQDSWMYRALRPPDEAHRPADLFDVLVARGLYDRLQRHRRDRDGHR